jgi:ribonuclease P protein component
VGRGNHCFRREERLRKRPQFLGVYAQGEKFGGSFFYAYFLLNQLPYSRLGLTVSRRVGGPVDRNRVKRRLREIFRHNKDRLNPPCDLVLNARRSAVGATFCALEEEFLRLAGKWSEEWAAGWQEPLES